MKFSEHLGTHLTPEWRSQYVDYDEMKKFIYIVSETAPPSDANRENLAVYYRNYDVGFFAYCGKELCKVNTFFSEKLSEAVRKYTHLKSEIASMLPVVNGEMNGLNTSQVKVAHKKKKLKEMKFVVCEFYLSLVLIQNFQQLNFTAFRKILKKHDKIFRTESGAEYRRENIENSFFYSDDKINSLILETEAIAIENLEGGNRSKAMERLRVLPLSEKQKASTTFYWGLFTGLFIVLLGVVIIAGYYKGPDLNWKPAFQIYRGLFLFYLMIGLVGGNIYGWGRAGVNHVLIFELDPRNHLSFAQLLMTSSLFGVLWCLSCIAFLFSKDFNFPMYAQPLALASFTLIYFINPTKTFFYRSRRWLLRILARIIAAPFVKVRFADFWLADQLNSLVVPILDMQYLLCFYVHGWYHSEDEGICTSASNVIRPILALSPAWFRFAQCLRRYKDTRKAFPHLVNAGKYSTSMFVTIISTVTSVKKELDLGSRSWLFYFWIASLILSTCYTLTWDLKMDWGLFAKNAGDNKFLRSQIVYGSKIYYYLAIIGDVIFRFLWTLTVSVGYSGFLHHEFVTLFLATCEAFRRFFWNFFRLENEHLNNIGEFRAVRDISIKPIINEMSSSETMLDVDDGGVVKKSAGSRFSAIFK